MITKWIVTLGSSHTVEVDHVGMSGAVAITVDGREELRSNLPRGRSLEHEFKLEGKPCTVRIVYKLEQFGGMATMETWDYELLVDGVKQGSAPKTPGPAKPPAPAKEAKKQWWEFWK